MAGCCLVQPRLSTDRQCALQALSRAPRIQTAQRAPRLPKAQRRYDLPLFLPLSPECYAIQSKRTKGKGRWHTCPAWVTSVLYTRVPKSSPSQWRDQARPCILLASPERIDDRPLILTRPPYTGLATRGRVATPPADLPSPPRASQS